MRWPQPGLPVPLPTIEVRLDSAEVEWGADFAGVFHVAGCPGAQPPVTVGVILVESTPGSARGEDGVDYPEGRIHVHRDETLVSNHPLLSGEERDWRFQLLMPRRVSPDRLWSLHPRVTIGDCDFEYRGVEIRLQPWPRVRLAVDALRAAAGLRVRGWRFFGAAIYLDLEPLDPLKHPLRQVELELDGRAETAGGSLAIQGVSRFGPGRRLPFTLPADPAEFRPMFEKLVRAHVSPQRFTPIPAEAPRPSVEALPRAAEAPVSRTEDLPTPSAHPDR
jgi:hypothetical protein